MCWCKQNRIRTQEVPCIMHPCHFLVFGVVVHHTTQQLPTQQPVGYAQKKWIEEKARCSSSSVEVAPKPMHVQPTRALRATWQRRSAGAVGSSRHGGLPCALLHHPSLCCLLIGRRRAGFWRARSRKSGFGEQERSGKNKVEFRSLGARRVNTIISIPTRANYYLPNAC
jgi:hypothetical protein